MTKSKQQQNYLKYSSKFGEHAKYGVSKCKNKRCGVCKEENTKLLKSLKTPFMNKKFRLQFK